MSETIAAPIPIPVPAPDALHLACRLARRFEGWSAIRYQDGDGTWTIGFGATYLADGSPVGPDTPPMTLAESSALLAIQMGQAIADVDSVVTPPLNPCQTAALADFVFNEGFGALRSSTLLKLLNQGDLAGAAAQFDRWDIAGVSIEPGLVRRRAAEAALFAAEFPGPVAP